MPRCCPHLRPYSHITVCVQSHLLDHVQPPEVEALHLDAMDPFSITIGLAGLAQVTVSVIDYLTSLKQASNKIQDEIDSLTKDVEALASVFESVENLPYLRRDWSSSGAPSDERYIVDLKKHLASVLQQSKSAVQELDALLKEVMGKKGNVVAGKIDGLRKTMRKQGREGDYSQLRQRLGNYQNSIQILLASLSMFV